MVWSTRNRILRTWARLRQVADFVAFTGQAGLDAMDAVELIRKRRRGAINRVQLKYVQDYKPTRKKKDGCVIA